MEKMILESVRVEDIFPSEFINLSAPEQKVSLETYRLLAAGQRVPLESVAAETGLSREDVQSMLKQ